MSFLDLYYQPVVFRAGDLESIGVDLNIWVMVEADMKKVFLELAFYLGQAAVDYFAALIDQDNLVADLFYLLHAMGAEYNGAAFFGQLVNFFLDKAGVYRVQSAERLIQYYEFGFMQYRNDKLQLLSHALA